MSIAKDNSLSTEVEGAVRFNYKRRTTAGCLSDAVRPVSALKRRSFVVYYARIWLQRSSQMAGRYPPPFLNTQEDRGAIVTVVSFTFVVVSTLTNCIRVAVRQQSERALGLDDALLVAANVSQIRRSTSRQNTDHASNCRL